MERHDCRLCGGALSQVFALKPSAIANDYKAEPDSGAKKYPLELMQCGDCGHVQQRYVLEGLFRDYKYATPQTVARYVHPVAKRIAEEYPGARVLEIGCNNGVFLDCLIAEGLEAWGVDPAASHKNSLKGYFDGGLARSLGKHSFDVVVGNNVFAHIDDLRGVFGGISYILKPTGCVVFEVQYLVDLVKSGEFDMIYHEHLDYHTLWPLVNFLEVYGMVVTKFDHIQNHGGSIRVWAKFAGEPCEIPFETLDWGALKERIEATKTRLRAVLRSHGSVVLYGAAAKATTLINELGIEKHIKFAVDDTPQKQYRFIPGTDIHIYPTSMLKPEDVVLLGAWNYADVISKKIPNKLIHPFRCGLE